MCADGPRKCTCTPPAAPFLAAPIHARAPYARAPPPQAFYLHYFRPRRAEWNKQPCRPHAPARLDAMEMFRRFLEAGESDPGQANLEAYLELWFQGMPWDQIKRGNMEELMAYGAPGAGWGGSGGFWEQEQLLSRLRQGSRWPRGLRECAPGWLASDGAAGAGPHRAAAALAAQRRVRPPARGPVSVWCPPCRPLGGPSARRPLAVGTRERRPSAAPLPRAVAACRTRRHPR
jgi:hypothetical protein